MMVQRGWLVHLILIVGMISLGPYPLSAQSAGDYPDLCFRIHMDGDPVGYDCVTVDEGEDRTTVRRSIRIRVSYFGFSAYLYRHEDREVWEGDHLIRLESWTDDNGDRFHVRARRSGDRLVVDNGDTQYVTTADIVPTSYWNRRLVEQSRLLDTQTGLLREVQISPADETVVTTSNGEVSVTRYRMRGDVRLKLGYDRNGVWRTMKFKKSGSTFRYELVDLDPSTWRSDPFYDRSLDVGNLKAVNNR